MNRTYGGVRGLPGNPAPYSICIGSFHVMVGNLVQSLAGFFQEMAAFLEESGQEQPFDAVGGNGN